MKIVPFDPSNWKKDHPTGAIAFQHMLKGDDPTSPENFMYILARQDADFRMPRHRHNFEQIRLPLKGPYHVQPGLTLEEGQIGYFPEGLAYGPQEDPITEQTPAGRLLLTLQFGGSSTYGFMSIEQRRQAWKELEKSGRFDGPFYVRPDGKREWGLNAVWKQVFGVRLKYPHPRYKKVIVADPKQFNWLMLKGSPGVDHKFMGSFSERGVWIEMVRLRGEASWSSVDESSQRLFVILSGEGTVDGNPLTPLTALQVYPGEKLGIEASSTMELFLVGLPPIEQPVVESDQFAEEEMRPEDQLE
ncbi:hypothetical protein [Paraburkholderia sp. GAS334]|uniref:hypothetical protein n=1 Tax=Paraburkholderia sp. GAS334 TaxID=3035131 RepID=UPI003D23F2EE